MKKLLNLGMTVVASATLVSCGKLVDVPPAHVGKVKLASGIQDELKFPSTFRLPPALTVRNELILVETSHFAIEENIKLFMPADKLNLTFDVRGTLFISPDQSAEIFEKITAKRSNENS